MINEEEKFDDLLRTKLSEREFFFDEENWQKLNEKIEKDEKRKKQTRTALIFLGGLLIGIGLTIPIMNLFKTSNNTISNTQGSTTNPAVNTPSVAVANNAAKAGSNTQPVVGAGSPASTPIGENANNETKVDNNVAKENNSVTSGPAEKASVTNHSAQVKHNNAVNNNVVVVNSTQPVASGNRHRNSTSNNSTLVNNSVAVNTNQPVSLGRRHRNDASNKTTTTVNKTVAAANMTTTNTTTAQTSGNESTGNAQPASQGNQTTVPSSAATAQANSTTPTKTATGNSSQTNNPNQQTAQANTTKTADSGSQNKTETASVTKQLPDIKTPARLKASNTLSIDAGGAYSLGWKNFGIMEANGVSPVFGVSATRTLSSKFAISLGVQYNSLNGLKTGYSNSVTSYDFGSRDSSTTVTPKTLQYITLPLSFRYLLDDNNAICLGGSFGYLLNVSSTVTTTTETALTAPVTKTQTANGYTGGFNTFDIQLRLAYRRRIYKSFSGSIEGYFGLTDDESGSYFDNTFKRNSGVRLIFSYDLLK